MDIRLLVLLFGVVLGQVSIQSESGEAVGIQLATNSQHDLTISSTSSNNLTITQDDINILTYINKEDIVTGDKLDKFKSDGDLRVVGDLIVNSLEDIIFFRAQEQWKLFHFNDFQIEKEGWSQQAVSSCSTSENIFLGGHCNFSYHEASKTYSNLPKHSRVMVKFNIHFFDDWNGEIAFAKIDDKIMWQESYNWCSKLLVQKCKEKGINTCGNDLPDRMSHPVTITFFHQESSFDLLVSSTLLTTPCDASWGIDDVQVYIL